jgi:hypothetical protein
VIFPAFLLGHNPRLRIFGISYGTELSAKHAADFRAIVESSWYRRAFPNMRISRAADSDVLTTAKGFRRSTSVNAALTGMGGHIIILDDPQKPVDAQSETLRKGVTQWFSNTLRSRLGNKETGILIVVMQRVHMLDLTGYLTESSDEWTVLSLPAIAESDEQIEIGSGKTYLRRAGEALHPAYESLATLEVGSDVFAAQYQQSPVPAGGAMIRKTMVALLRDRTGAHVSDQGYPELGHRGQEPRPERLVSLYDVAHSRKALLPARCHARPLRIS